MSRLRWTLALALALGAAPPARALTGAGPPERALAECNIEIWRARDGLPGWVRALAQTRDGYLWVGSNAGLYRYGGGPVVAVELEPAVARAADVTGLFVSRDGTLWVSPARGTPVCVRAGAVADCLPAGSPIDPGTRVAAVTQDADGAIWIGATEGVFRFANGKLTLVHPAGGLPGGRVLALRTGAKPDHLAIGTPAGLVIGDARTGSAAVSAFFAKDDHLWAAGDEGLVRVQGDRRDSFTGGFPDSRPTAVIEDRDGNVWLASRRGLTRFRDGRFVTFTRDDGLPEDDVTAVFEDREGSLWVGTRGGGLAQLSERTLDAEAGPPSLRDRWINAVVEDAQGTLWVGTRTGLLRFADGREATFTTADGLPADDVRALALGRDGAIYVGTSAGLARAEIRGERLVFSQPGRFTAPVAAVFIDAEDAVWLGTSDGVARLRNDRVEPLPVEPAAGPLTEVRGFAGDDRGTLWLSAGGRLLRIVDGRVALPPSDPVLAKVGKVRALYRDGDGSLWLASYDGLVHGRAGVWRAFGAREGVIPHDLQQIVGDSRGAEGFLWASTNQGVVRIARQALAEVEAGRRAAVFAVAFQTSNQRRSVEGVRGQPGSFRGANDRLWFATSRGVVKVDPARLRVNPVPPSVVIEAASVDGRPAHRGAVNRFPPGPGAIELAFAVVTLLDPHKARARYRLEGFDSTWIEAGSRRVAYYTNIGPGDYRFRVEAANADGVWGASGDALLLTLAPHFYEAWWFYALLGAGALGLAFSAHRLRVAKVHDRYAATFAERNRVARELHDSLLQGMSAAVLHLKGLRKRFARAGLPPVDAVTGELERIEGLLGSNIEETRRYVWQLRETSRGAEALEPQLVKVAARLEGAAAGGDRPVVVRVTSQGPAAPLPDGASRALVLIAQEAIGNALKHGRASRVDVTLAYEGDRVRLTVSDDGAGFDLAGAPGPNQGHFGLVGMRERVAVLGAASNALVIDSKPGAGTRVEVTISRRALRDD